VKYALLIFEKHSVFAIFQWIRLNHKRKYTKMHYMLDRHFMVI